jgi:tetratricopeptide (TPR) repeat protein
MKGNPEKAEGSFRDAIAMHPEVPLGYIALAKAFMKSSRAAEAVTLLAGARSKLPPDFTLEYFYGLALENAGQDQPAAAAFSRASELNPDVPDAHFHLGKLLFKAGETVKAKLELERAIALNPANAAAHFQLSRVYAKLGDSVNTKKFAARAAALRRKQVDSSLQRQPAPAR